MPPLRLTNLLHSACPDVSPTTRAILSTLGCSNGAPHADEVAAWVGLRDRHQVHRWLRRDGLPPLKRLSGWTRVLYWLLEAEASHASLLQLARREHIDVATAYRIVVRVTGTHWSQLRRAGLAAALSRFQRDVKRTGARLQDASTPQYAVDRPAGPSRPVAAPVTKHPASTRPAGNLAERVGVSGCPYDVVIDRRGVAYVTQLHAAALQRLAVSPLRVTGSIPTGAAPTIVLPSAVDTRAFVINQFSEDVTILDLEDGRVVKRVPIPGDPLFAALALDQRTLYVVTNTDRMWAMALPNGHLVASGAIERAGYGLCVHPSGRWVYTPSFRKGTVTELDARTLVTTRTFATGGVTQECVVSHDGMTLYSANEDGWLDVLHLPSGRQVTRVNFGTGAISLALSPDGAELYVGLKVAGRVARIDRVTLRIQGMIETGGMPRRIAFEERGRWALIANEAGWVDLVL